MRPQPAPKGAERALCLGPVPAAPSAASAPALQTLRPDPLPEMAVSCPGIGVTGGHRKGPLPFLLSARERLKAAPGATESFVGASSEITTAGRKEPSRGPVLAGSCPSGLCSSALALYLGGGAG